eukprot:5015290-Amphidinium_carterae.1
MYVLSTFVIFRSKIIFSLQTVTESARFDLNDFMRHVVTSVQQRQQLWFAHPNETWREHLSRGHFFQGFSVPEATTLVSAAVAHELTAWHNLSF